MLKRAAKTREMKKKETEVTSSDWNKFQKLREELELPDKPELERKFKALSREQRIELIRDCEKKVLIKAGEKDYEFLWLQTKC